MHYARDRAKPMIDRDRVDEQLSQAAHDWLAWRSDIVDLDTEFTALEGVLAGQSDLRQLDRRHADRTRILAVAASVLILAAGIAAIVWSQGNRHPDSVVPPVDTVEPQITVAPSVAGTSTSTVAVTTIPIADSCSGQPMPPPTLSDGSAVGFPVVDPTDGGGRIARWGEVDAPNVVYQPLDVTLDPSSLDIAVAEGRAITSGPYEAAAIPVGDPPVSQITIYVRDVGAGCLRAYIVGPGLLQADAVALATQWIDALVGPD